MLHLNDPRWNSLTHAYGAASDVPELLAELHTAHVPENYEEEPWFSLWSALCHQYDIYTASYAAVPHVIAIAATRPAEERVEHLHFAAWVEICRHRKSAPAIPPDLADAYHAALVEAGQLVIENLQLDWAEDEYQVLLGALPAFRGHYRLGAGIIEMSGDEQCPNCSNEFAIRGYNLFPGE